MQAISSSARYAPTNALLQRRPNSRALSTSNAKKNTPSAPPAQGGKFSHNVFPTMPQTVVAFFAFLSSLVRLSCSWVKLFVVVGVWLCTQSSLSIAAVPAMEEFLYELWFEAAWMSSTLEAAPTLSFASLPHLSPLFALQRAEFDRFDDGFDGRLSREVPPSVAESIALLQREQTTDSVLTNSTSSTISQNSSEPLNDSVAAFIKRRAAIAGDTIIHLRELREALKLDSLGMRSMNVGAPVQRSNEFSRVFSAGYGFSATLDTNESFSNERFSAGNNQPVMRLRESFFGVETAPSEALPFDEYLRRRQEYLRRAILDSALRHYDIKRTSRFEFANILNQIGRINLPIPQNPISGIFGKPDIRLNINAEYSVKLGASWTTQNLGTTSAFGQTQFVPIFNQDIQFSADASIGDKVKIAFDQNTKRLFEFDNITNIAFDGDADDIFKRVEIGNVQFSTPSTFISSSQSMFGARLDLQFGPLYLKTIFSQKRGQRRSVPLTGGAVKQPFQLRAYDYADNHFFLDTAYKPVFTAFYSGLTNIVPQVAGAEQLIVKELEVWESSNVVSEQATLSTAVAFAELPSVPLEGGSYPRAFTTDSLVNAGRVEKGGFKKLTEGRDYTYDSRLGWLTLAQLRRDRTYAVAYRVEGATVAETDDRVYGTMSYSPQLQQDSTRILKLIYRPNLQPGFKALWARLMQNIYSIGASNVDLAQTRISMWYLRQNNDSADVLEGAKAGDKVVTVLGVDRVNKGTGAAPPDGEFDVGTAGGAQALVFRADRGEIIFPNLEPFRDGLRKYFASINKADVAEKYVYSAVYDTTRDAARLDAGRDRFVIGGEVTGASAGNGKFQIPQAFNLAPGSVKVTLNGALLQEYADYRVEYFTGQITITNPNAFLPNAKLDIEYEQNDPFNIATRTQWGFRADLDTKSIFRSRNFTSTLGFTFMNYDQALVTDRVRIGEESMRNLMMGLDGSFTLDAPWLTRALDALPFVETKAPSSITGRGEVAVMLPDPNKRRSDIPSDNGASVVYVDDFESGSRPLSFGLQPQLWTYAAPPRDSVDGVVMIGSDKQRDSASMLFRGKLNWYRFSNPETPLTDVYPNRVATYVNRNIPTMFINFDPDVRGVYNPNVNYKDSITYITSPKAGNTIAERLQAFNAVRNSLFQRDVSNRKRIWGGFQRLLSSFNTNFDNDNVEYIEIKVKINEREPGAQMFVDLGQVSEDVIANGTLNTEDGIGNNPVPNSLIDSLEDRGLDMLSNAQERGLEAIPLAVVARRALPFSTTTATLGADTTASLIVKTDAATNMGVSIFDEPDPSRDDFVYDFNLPSVAQVDSLFVGFNGVEGNGAGQSGAFPDTEILNRNNGQNASLDNSFFRYPVDISNLNPAQNPQIVDRTAQGWYTFRIPIRNNPTRQSIGTPLLTNIQYVRVWWRGGKFKGQIADWQAVGSQWQRFRATLSDGTPDNVSKVYYVGTDNNSGAPNNYTLPPGVRQPRVLGNPDPNQDVPQPEQSLALEVLHLPGGSERMAVRYFRPMDLFFYKQMKFFIHGGGRNGVPLSSLEGVQAFVRFGVDSANYYEYSITLQNGWQDLGIVFDKITALKVGAEGGATTFDDKGGRYSVSGNPTLTRIQFIGFGIRNTKATELEEAIMWVNELRLIEPASQIGVAGVGNMTLKLADLATASVTYNSTDPYFHRLEERFGTRFNRSNLSITANTDLVRWIPFLSLLEGTSIPFSYIRTQSSDRALYVPQNDMNVDTTASNFVQRAAALNPMTQKTTIDSLNKEADRLRRRASTNITEEQFAIVGARVYSSSAQGWFMRDIINRFEYNFSYATRREESPVVDFRRRWTWLASIKYSHTFPQLPFKPFSWAEGVPLLSAFKDYTIFLTPSNVAASIEMRRERTFEQSWFLNVQSPVIQDFRATRDFRVVWKLSENGLLNPTLDYSLRTMSTLVPLESRTGLDQDGLPKLDIIKNDLEVWRDSIFFNSRRPWYLGPDVQSQQNVSLDMNPKIPEFLGGRFFSITSKYNSIYRWQNVLPTGTLDLQDAGKQAVLRSSFNANMTIRLRDLGNSIFTGSSASAASATQPLGDGGFTSAPVAQDTALPAWVRVVKTVLFDFDRVSIVFSTTNDAQHTGLQGGAGLWERLPFGETGREFGPEMPYQLGFQRAPTYRARNLILPEQYKRESSLDVTMQRPLWDGATLALNWSSKWSATESQNVVTDGDGLVARSQNRLFVRTYDRSFLSFPSLFPFLDETFNSIERVKKLYGTERDRLRAGFAATPDKDSALKLIDALSSAFENGLEFLPWVPREVRQILPRMNWTFRWNGLERLKIFEKFVRSASLEHRYSSRLSANERETDIGTVRDGTQVDVGFQPLIGLTAQFDETALEGLLAGTMRYSTRSSYRLTVANRGNVARESSNEFTLQATYTRRNVKLSLLDMEFESDMDFALQASYRRTLSSAISLLDGVPPSNVATVPTQPTTGDAATARNGQTLDGRTSLVFEPSVRYVLSSRLTARAFFRYELNLSEGAAAPGSSTTQFGVDLRLVLAGPAR